MDPAWWIPDAVVLGVKVASVAHGMDVEIVTVFAGEAQEGDTVRVWGDTGLLCRMYADSWSVGDTVVWGLRWTDMAGGSMEQEGDYLISVCGQYWLDYENGIVTGPLFEEGVTESVPIEDFATLVHGCLVTGVTENEDVNSLIVRDGDDGIWLSLALPLRAQLAVTDATGRACIRREWDGSPMQLEHMHSGAYVVQVRAGERVWSRNVILR